MSRRCLVLGVVVVLFGVLTTVVYNVTRPESNEADQMLNDDLPAIEANESHVSEGKTTTAISDPIRSLYEPLTPFTFGTKSMYASIADNNELRTKGLSGTPSLPADIAKVFVFEKSGKYGFWMKDMNYPIDIIWVNENGEVVHIAPEVSPATYPASFAPPLPARIVIEVVAGGATEMGVRVGSVVDVRSFLVE